MSSRMTPRVRVPASAKAGEVIEVRSLIAHEMESGQRRDAQGALVPRLIIHAFRATYNGREVFRAEWHPAISANPYQAFHLRVTEPGELVLTWTDDSGASAVSRHRISVAS
jgi:sulfur-oxidizing protein SoxZ